MINEDQHIIPLDDLRLHITAVSCHCKPVIEKQDNGNRIIIHNAYDGREFVEIDIEGH